MVIVVAVVIVVVVVWGKSGALLIKIEHTRLVGGDGRDVVVVVAVGGRDVGREEVHFCRGVRGGRAENGEGADGGRMGADDRECDAAAT